MRESDILYQKGDFWVCKATDASKGFEVYRDGVTHATRCAIIGYKGDDGLQRAKTECDRRYAWRHGHPVAVYLMSCYAYEELDAPFLTDAEFDALGRYIEAHWDELEHRHKHLIDRDSCAYTSGITKPYAKWPLIIKHAAHHAAGYPKAQKPRVDVDDLIG